MISKRLQRLIRLRTAPDHHIRRHSGFGLGLRAIQARIRYFVVRDDWSSQVRGRVQALSDGTLICLINYRAGSLLAGLLPIDEANGEARAGHRVFFFGVFDGQDSVCAD